MAFIGIELLAETSRRRELGTGPSNANVSVRLVRARQVRLQLVASRLVAS